MFKLNKFFIVFVIISMLFMSVEIFADSSEKIILRSDKNIPYWISNTPEDHYIGVSDKNTELDLGIKQAVNNSFLYVLMKLGVSVSSNFEVNTKVVGEDFVRDIIDELNIKGTAEFQKQHVKSTYYEKYRVFGKDYFRVSVLVYFSPNEITKIRERFSKERDVLKKDIDNFFAKSSSIENSFEIRKNISDLYNLWKKADSLLMDKESSKILSELTNIVLSIKVELIDFKDNMLKLKIFFVKDNKNIILNNMFYEYSLTYGRGFVEKFGMTDNNGFSNIRADISEYIDSKAILKAQPVWNQIVLINEKNDFSDILEKSANEILIKKKSILVVFADSSNNEFANELFSMFSNISEISVLKSKLNKSEDIFSQTSSDYVVISQKSRGKALFSIFNKNSRGAQKAIYLENKADDLSKNSLFSDFLKIIIPSKIFLQKLEIYPKEVKWYYENDKYSLENVKVYACYSDGRREEKQNIKWKIKNADGRIENNVFFINKKTGTHVLECEYEEDGIKRKDEFKINMHWEKGVTAEDALDTDIKLEMPSNLKWQGITWDSSDGMDSLATGDFAKGESILQIRLNGPEEFKFAWKINGEEANDVILFYLNEKLKWAITGNTVWETKSVSLASGSNVLKWVYKKTSGLSYMESNAKLDKFEYSGNGEGGSLIKLENIQKTAKFRDRTHSQMFSLNGKMFLIGGESSRRVRGDIWSSKDGFEWNLERTQGEFGARKDFRVCVMNNIVYLTGGTNSRGNPLNDVWFSTDGIYWKNIRKNAEFDNRYAHNMIEHNGKLYLAGGSNGRKYFNDVWVSDNGEKWELLTQSASFEARRDFNMINSDKGIFIINGKGENKTYSDTWFSKDGRIWTKSSERSSSQAFAGGAIVKTSIYYYMLGGVEENGMLSVFKNRIYKSMDCINWDMVATNSIFEPRAWFQALFHNGAVYIAGGEDMKNKFADIWRIDISN